MASPGPNDLPLPVAARNTGTGTQSLFTGTGNQYHAAAGASVNYIDKYIVGSPKDQTPDVIIEWLGREAAPLDLLASHRLLISQRTPATGLWVLKSKRFLDWKQEASECRMLWMHGIMGSGKSILTSLVIEQLEKEIANQDTMACVYAHFQDPDQKFPYSQILASLLRQLVQQKKNRPIVEALLLKHREYLANMVPPSAEQYLDLLLAEVATFRQVFLVIDALENCSESIHVQDMIGKLPRTVKVLITTRSNSPIGNELGIKEPFQLEVKANDPDIKAYVKSRIVLEKHVRGFIAQEGDPNFENTVIQRIRVGAGDMFLLAKLHLDALSKQRSLADFKSVLSELPKDAAVAFKAAIERIDQQEEVDRALAGHVFTWLLNAEQPVTAPELQHSFAIRQYKLAGHDSNGVLSDYSPPEGLLLSVCGGLVVMDQKTQVLQLVHDAVNNHLAGHSLLPKDPHNVIARQCIDYLSLDDFLATATSEQDLAERLHNFPFLKYAAQHWATHLRYTGEDATNELTELALDYLENSAKVTSAYKYALTGGPQNMTGLHAAVYLNSKSLTKGLLKRYCDVNATCSYGQTALHWAVRLQRDKLIRLLLDYAACTAVCDANGDNALHLAVTTKDLTENTITRLVISDASQMNKPNQLGYTPFSWSLKHGEPEMARILAKWQPDKGSSGGQPDAPPSPLNLAMNLATKKEMPKLVELLLDGGTDPNVPSTGDWPPLLDATVRGLQEVCQVLLRNGADVDVTNSHGSTALMLATDPEIVCLLLNHGASMEVKEEEGFTPLLLATSRERRSIAWLLVEAGADIDEQDSAGFTPVHWAIQRRDTLLTWLMVTEGCDLSLRDAEGLSPLDWAVSLGDASTVWLLCEDQKRLVPGMVSTALHQVAKYSRHESHAEILQILMRKGARETIDSQDGEGCTALMHAADRLERPMIRTLVDTGASCNIRDNSGATALHHAIKATQVDQIDCLVLLTKHGALIDIQDDFGMTPLMLAAQMGHGLTVYTLLSMGAQRHLLNLEGDTALNMAIKQRHEPVIVLLSTGMDV